ncbi:MAG: glycosyltransferase [Syntrophomonadaceae bacterium]|nr:glycosyltransferase [Syntrophomonadaceae bacterium]
MTNLGPILYPPTLDFNYLVQRPQQLMKSFAELGLPVYWENRPSPHNSQIAGISEITPNFFLFNNVDSRPFLENIHPVVYYSATAQVDEIKKYNPSLVVFDSVDEPSDEFESWRPYYHRAVSSADLVITTSSKLHSMALALNPYSYMVPNGCDYEYFSRASRGALPVPEDIAAIPGPIIGYIGVVATWLDFELIDHLAQAYPNCNIVIIGPLYNVTDVPRRSNIHYLGFKPYEQLAAYAQAFSVGIIPFKLSSMVESVNPIKMWEYMATGIPIVSTNLPETEKYRDIVHVSVTYEDFISNIQRALYDDTDDLRSKRLAVAAENSWISRARQIIALMEERLAAKGVAQPVAPVSPPTFITSELDQLAPVKISLRGSSDISDNQNRVTSSGSQPLRVSISGNNRVVVIVRGGTFRLRVRDNKSSAAGVSDNIATAGIMQSGIRVSRKSFNYRTARAVQRN